MIVRTFKRLRTEYPIKHFLLISCFLFLSFNELWHYYSPLPATSWINDNLRKLKVHDTTDFSFAVFGDSRNSLYIFRNILSMLDHDSDTAFVICLGNFVNTGKKEQYRSFLEKIKGNSTFPLLTTIGDHEARGKGRTLYHDIFGPLFYSFQIGENYFIVLDTTDTKDPGDEQIEWLEKELIKSGDFKNRLIFSHIPLYDPRKNKDHCLSEKASSTIDQSIFEIPGNAYILIPHPRLFRRSLERNSIHDHCRSR